MSNYHLCPMCGNRDYPPLQMQPLRRVACVTHRLECAQLGLPPPEGYASLDEANSRGDRDWEAGMVLNGLQDDLACRHLLARRWERLITQLIAHGDALPPLELVPRSVSGAYKEDGR